MSCYVIIFCLFTATTTTVITATTTITTTTTTTAIRTSCKAGEWTKAVGDDKTGMTCLPCSAGRFRPKPPEVKQTEVETSVCLLHKKCKPGERTKTVADARSNPICEACASGRFMPGACQKLVPQHKSFCDCSAHCPLLVRAFANVDDMHIFQHGMCATCKMAKRALKPGMMTFFPGSNARPRSTNCRIRRENPKPRM